MGAYTCEFGIVHKTCRCPTPHTIKCDNPEEHKGVNYVPKHRKETIADHEPSWKCCDLPYEAHPKPRSHYQGGHIPQDELARQVALGHGRIKPRADGAVAKCMGVGRCLVCTIENGDLSLEP